MSISRPMVPWPLHVDNVFVVKGVDKCITALVPLPYGLGVSIVIDPRDQAYLRPVAPGRLDLGDGRTVRQADNGSDTVLGSCKSHALGMVARRAGDNAMALLLVGKLGDLVVSAPDLERACYLQILGLEKNIAVRVHIRSGYTGGRPDDLLQNIRCVKYFVQSKH